MCRTKKSSSQPLLPSYTDARPSLRSPQNPQPSPAQAIYAPNNDTERQIKVRRSDFSLRIPACKTKKDIFLNKLRTHPELAPQTEGLVLQAPRYLAPRSPCRRKSFSYNKLVLSLDYLADEHAIQDVQGAQHICDSVCVLLPFNS